MEQQQESLNLNDLKLMAQIIKVVSTRGAIQAEEMAAVGILYTKLISFIKTAEPAEDAEAGEAKETTTATVVETPEGN